MPEHRLFDRGPFLLSREGLLECREKVLNIVEVTVPGVGGLNLRAFCAYFSRNAESALIIDSIASNHPRPSIGDLKRALS